MFSTARPASKSQINNMVSHSFFFLKKKKKKNSSTEICKTLEMYDDTISNGIIF
uniref:Uncharacterized protein n=1 Tax=Anguilla anguilla TaxID=7936 RepID=A0A0E9RK84_ANGAN